MTKDQMTVLTALLTAMGEQWARVGMLQALYADTGAALNSAAQSTKDVLTFVETAHTAPEPAPDQQYVPYPDKADVTPEMERQFERLFAEFHGKAKLRKAEDGTYFDLKTQADWVFYRRAWADAMASEMVREALFFSYLPDGFTVHVEDGCYRARHREDGTYDGNLQKTRQAATAQAWAKYARRETDLNTEEVRALRRQIKELQDGKR